MKVVETSMDPLVGIVAKTGVYPGMASFDRLKGVEGRRKKGRILGRKGLEAHCYHLMSRTCGGEIWFDEVEPSGARSITRSVTRRVNAWAFIKRRRWRS